MAKFERILSLLGFIPNNFSNWEQKCSIWKVARYIYLIIIGLYFLYAIIFTPAALNKEYDKIRWVNVWLTRTTMTIESSAILYHVYHIKIKGSPHVKSTLGHEFKKPKSFQYIILILSIIYKWIHYYYVYVFKNDFEMRYFFAGVILDSSSFVILSIFAFVIEDVSGRVEELSRSLDGGNAVRSSEEHRLVCGFLAALNRTFSTQMFMICLKYSIHIIRKSYQVCLFWLACTEECEIVFSVESAVWIFWNLIVIAVLVKSCENARRKVDYFNTELFLLMQKEGTLCKNEKLFLYVNVKPSVNFTACGFFTLGYPFIGSIIAATVTYLVILVQFSIAGSSE